MNFKGINSIDELIKKAVTQSEYENMYEEYEKVIDESIRIHAGGYSLDEIIEKELGSNVANLDKYKYMELHYTRSFHEPQSDLVLYTSSNNKQPVLNNETGEIYYPYGPQSDNYKMIELPSNRDDKYRMINNALEELIKFDIEAFEYSREAD